MSYYPVLIDSKQINALVIGAGEVGLRKIESLLKQDVGNITVYDNALAFEDFKYKDENSIHYYCAEFDVKELGNFNLVFIATNNKQINSFYTNECQKRKILCNVATKPQEASFALPALIQKGDILITLSTNASSPALTRALKADLERFIDNECHEELCVFLGRLRPLILDLGLDTKENTEIFRSLVHSPHKENFQAYFTDKNEKTKNKLEQELKKSFNAQVLAIILQTL